MHSQFFLGLSTRGAYTLEKSAWSARTAGVIGKEESVGGTSRFPAEMLSGIFRHLSKKPACWTKLSVQPAFRGPQTFDLKSSRMIERISSTATFGFNRALRLVIGNFHRVAVYAP